MSGNCRSSLQHLGDAFHVILDRGLDFVLGLEVVVDVAAGTPAASTTSLNEVWLQPLW